MLEFKSDGKKKNITGLYFMSDGKKKRIISLYIKSDGKKKYIFKALNPYIELTIAQSAPVDFSEVSGINMDSIDWGDGTVTTDTLSHTYESAGTYRIKANFNDVVTLGRSFLNSTFYDSKIVFNDFVNLETISDSLLYFHQYSTGIEFKGKTKVKTIGNGFLRSSFNRGVSPFKLFDLSLVESIGNEFLGGCVKLASIDLSALSKCKTIGSYFLFSTIITSLDLRNLTSLESIGTNFLHNCSNLSEIWLPQRTPPTLVRWGDGLYGISKIHCGSYLNQYKSASVWSNYSSLMVE